MKKSKLVMLLTIFVVIPLTIFLGDKLPGRSYYLTSTLILVEIMLPFFLRLEGRKPQARELVVIAVLCALAVASRVVIHIPNFKATYALIILSAIALGPESGFLIGATTALVSNFFFGQGPFTPWQMMAYGVAGLLAGFVYQKNWLKRKPLSIAIFSAVLIVAVTGPILDTCTVFLFPTQLNAASVAAIYAAGLPVNISQASATFLVVLLLGMPLLQILDRILLQYGLTDKG
jgi:uncharacterized membrane protein